MNLGHLLDGPQPVGTISGNFHSLLLVEPTALSRFGVLQIPPRKIRGHALLRWTIRRLRADQGHPMTRMVFRRFMRCSSLITGKVWLLKRMAF
jgi:hypothetical protein